MSTTSTKTTTANVPPVAMSCTSTMASLCSGVTKEQILLKTVCTVIASKCNVAIARKIRKTLIFEKHSPDNEIKAI